MYTIARFFPVPDPRIIGAIKQVENKKPDTGIAYRYVTKLDRGIQQMCRVVAILTFGARTQIQNPAIFSWSVWPLELRIGLERHSSTESCWADLTLCGRHIEHRDFRFQERWPESHVVIPGNWSVERGQVISSFFAIHNWMRAIE